MAKKSKHARVPASPRESAMEDGQSGLLPKLRFPEFLDTNGWKLEKLGPKSNKVGSGITPRGGEKNYKKSGRPFVRSQNVGWGELLLDDVAFIDEDTHSSFSSTEIETYDVLLNITGASIGRTAVADARIAGGNVNQHVCIIRTKPAELSPYFLNQFLISQDGQTQIDSFQAGGNRQGLNFEQIRSLLIPLPNTQTEQQKIASCLSTLDELIGAQGRKVAALRTHKKGLMQQLFPCEGETQPRLRFPEFQDAGDWEEMNLADLAESISSGKDNAAPDGLFDLYGSTGIIGKANSRSYSGTYLLVARVGANAGFLTKATGDFGVTDNTLVIVLKAKLNIDFVFYYLHQINLNKMIFGSGQPLITGGQLKALKIKVPTHQTEQQRIASCLSSLDELITAETQKLEALKTHKRGLMQQLFPSPEDAS
jgi:type I restriction enzyme S subunit